MEEQQIKDIVHRASIDETFRQELVSNTAAVIEREGLSPHVAEVVTRLAPHLSLATPPFGVAVSPNSWWRV